MQKPPQEMQLRRLLALIRDVLREIFDEASYARYLERHSLPTSPRAYQAFLRDDERISSPKARCC